MDIYIYRWYTSTPNIMVPHSEHCNMSSSPCWRIPQAAAQQDREVLIFSCFTVAPNPQKHIENGWKMPEVWQIHIIYRDHLKICLFHGNFCWSEHWVIFWARKGPPCPSYVCWFLSSNHRLQTHTHIYIVYDIYIYIHSI